MPHEMGPRAKISFIMALAPRMEPNWEMVALGYCLMPTHLPCKVQRYAKCKGREPSEKT